MLAKRVIPCLDVMHGRAVKGVQFQDLKDAGDIVELGKKYAEEGADELVFLDITASNDKRKTVLEWVEQVAAEIDIPFTVGGGVTSEKDVEALLKRGADKITVNSSVLNDPNLINRLAYSFGKQCIVVAIDAKEEGGRWEVYSKGGRERTARELFPWAQEVEERGGGEILFTSMNHDGTHRGFAYEALARLGERAGIPLIASGGAGRPEDFYRVFQYGKVEAALAAGIFHYGEISIKEVKEYLRKKGIEVR